MIHIVTTSLMVGLSNGSRLEYLIIFNYSHQIIGSVMAHKITQKLLYTLFASSLFLSCTQEDAVISTGIATNTITSTIKLPEIKSAQMGSTRTVAKHDTIYLSPVEGDGPKLMVVGKSEKTNPNRGYLSQTRTEPLAQDDQTLFIYNSWGDDNPSNPNPQDLYVEESRNVPFDTTRVFMDGIPLEYQVKQYYRGDEYDREYTSTSSLFGLIQTTHRAGDYGEQILPNERPTIEKDENGIINKFSFTYQVPSRGAWKLIHSYSPNYYAGENYAFIGTVFGNSISAQIEGYETSYIQTGDIKYFRSIVFNSRKNDSFSPSGNPFGYVTDVYVSDCYPTVKYTASRSDNSIVEEFSGELFVLHFPAEYGISGYVSTDPEEETFQARYFVLREKWKKGFIRIKFSATNERGEHPHFTYDLTNLPIESEVDALSVFVAQDYK